MLFERLKLLVDTVFAASLFDVVPGEDPDTVWLLLNSEWQKLSIPGLEPVSTLDLTTLEEITKYDYEIPRWADILRFSTGHDIAVVGCRDKDDYKLAYFTVDHGLRPERLKMLAVFHKLLPPSEAPGLWATPQHLAWWMFDHLRPPDVGIYEFSPDLQCGVFQVEGHGAILATVDGKVLARFPIDWIAGVNFTADGSAVTVAGPSGEKWPVWYAEARNAWQPEELIRLPSCPGVLETRPGKCALIATSERLLLLGKTPSSRQSRRLSSPIDLYEAALLPLNSLCVLSGYLDDERQGLYLVNRLSGRVSDWKERRIRGPISPVLEPPSPRIRVDKRTGKVFWWDRDGALSIWEVF